MFHRQLFASSALAFCVACVAGCAPDDERSRVVTQLPRDGYAQFEVKPGGAKRVAVIVEMRDVEEGTFVLLYTRKEPTSSGWFELDPDAYVPCRHYGPDSTDVDVGCIVPSGHGAIVDVVVATGSSQTILRHQLGEGDEDASCGCTKSAPAGFYALMRIAKTGPAIPMAVEVSAMDDTEPYESPSITVRR